jgi:hypothetical protein
VGYVIALSLDIYKVLPNVNGSLGSFSSHIITNSTLLPKGPYTSSAYISDSTNILPCLARLSGNFMSFSRLDGAVFSTSQHTILVFTMVYRGANADALSNSVWVHLSKLCANYILYICLQTYGKTMTTV